MLTAPWARRAMWSLVVAVIVAALGTTLALWRYPGLSAAVFDQARHAGFRESRNNYRFLAYLARRFAQLSLGSESGYYDFAAARRRARTNEERGILAYHGGDFATAIGLLEQAIDAGGESEVLLFWLANSHLRLAEADNCLGGHPSPVPSGDPQALCSLPLTSHHHRRENTLRAAELFGLLHHRHPDDGLYLWLLNFTHMTLGSFPAGLPVNDRIETPLIDAFYGRRAQELAARNGDLVFEDRAAAFHVDTFDAGKGVAVEDFDGDGDLDIVTGGNFDPLRYYESQEGRDFVDRTDAAGLGGITQVHIITAADYDNDGQVDLFVGRPFLHYLLLHNNGDGTFDDVTASSGLLAGWLDNEVSFTWSSAWGDADNDGDLDLFIARWGMDIPFLGGPLGQPHRSSLFFLNDGGRFADHTAASGLGRVVRDRAFMGAAWGDADNDGDLDLFLSGLAQRGSRLLRNLGRARFEEIEQHGPGFTAAFVDIDHDGRLEIFQGGFTDARTSTAGAVFGESLGRAAGRSLILRRGRAGRFEPSAAFFDGGDLPIATMGTSYGDLDNDGCLDFYLGTGNPEGWFVLPSLMFRGLRKGRECEDRAANISMLNGFGTIQKGHGIVFFDFDNDGDQDIYSSLGGMWPGDRWPNQLFVNESRIGNRWLKIRLRGRRSNRFGLGARITVRAIGDDGASIVRTYAMDHKTGFGSSPYLAHIGLLDAVAIREVQVWWPVSGRRCSYPARLESVNWLDEAACLQKRDRHSLASDPAT